MSRNRIPSPMDHVNLIGKLADLKEQHYQNTVTLTAILELLIEKGILTEQEFLAKADEPDVRPISPLAANPNG